MSHERPSVSTILLNRNVAIIDTTDLPSIAYAREALQRDLQARLGLPAGPAERTIQLSIDKSLTDYDTYQFRLTMQV